MLHDLHVGGDHRLAKAAELLLVLLFDRGQKCLIRNSIVLQERRHAEERSEERVALHAQLKIAAIRGFPGNFEAWQNVDSNVVILDELSMMCRYSLPGRLNSVTGFPDQATTLVQTFKGICVRECLRITAEDHIDVVQFAIDANTLWGNDEIVISGRAFFLGAVLRVCHDPNLFDLLAIFVVFRILFGNQAAEIANN